MHGKVGGERVRGRERETERERERGGGRESPHSCTKLESFEASFKNIT